jgi:hypothetical protein
MMIRLRTDNYYTLLTLTHCALTRVYADIPTLTTCSILLNFRLRFRSINEGSSSVYEQLLSAQVKSGICLTCPLILHYL